MASPALTALAALAAALPGAGGLHMTRRTSPERACSETPDVDFSDFIRRHQRTYKDDPGEYSLRAELFLRAKEAVRRHNCETERPLWVASVNHLADWTDAELESLQGLELPRRGPPGAAPSMRLPRAGGGEDLPDTISYANLSTIRDGRNQGHCGSCWAFAAESAMRARAELKGLPHKFAVGQIVACAPNPHECGGKGGCKGATTELAYEYALQAGLVQEEDAGRHKLSYPAAGGQPECPRDMAMSGSEMESSKASTTSDGYEEHVAGEVAVSLRRGRNTGMVGWTKLPENRMEPIIRALMESGPLTVSVAAGRWWHYYTEGIMPGSDCDENNVVGHAVVLFGIGKEDVEGVGQLKYWHLKNSWGNTWGEDGHIRVEMTANEEEQCGWDNKPQSGSGCVGGPEKVWVCGSCAILYNSAMPLF